ncbi:MAG: VWA domain-containing protein [Myxococcales bacterium]|nr:VWA domain-containing protein [Myxococcales bacterium]
MKPFSAVLACAGLVPLALAAPAWADAGVLIPWNISHEPDPKVLSLKRMEVTVRIDHLHARVDLKSVFENHTNQQLEGRYVLPLGERSSVEDFSVWQGEERLVGVIVEKQKGKRLFEQITRQNLDPGLAESDDNKDKAHDFVIRVAPIPPHGTARVEVTFSEDLTVTSRGALFTLPWKPRRYGTQRVDALHVDVAADGPFPLASVKVRPEGRLRWTTAPVAGSTRFAGILDGKNVALGDDLTIEMALADGGPKVDALAWRDPVPGGRKDLSPFGDGTVYRDDRGYFLVRALFGIGGGPAVKRAPRDVVILLDTSLSMQWEKLERSFAALEYFTGRLEPGDRFGLITFNDEVRPYKPDLVAASSTEVQGALQFVRQSYLAGGTDLGGALAASLALVGKDVRPGSDRFVVMITDGNPTLGEIGYRQIGKAFAEANVGNSRRAASSESNVGRAAPVPPVGGAPATAPPIARLFVLGVGDDAATVLLDRLAAAGDGFFAWAREGSDAAFKLRTFFDKLGQGSLRDVALAFTTLTGIEQIYPPIRPSVFEGSDAPFFGRYKTPGAGAVAVRGTLHGQPVSESMPVTLPERDATRPWVARGWARYRIDDLLDKIAVDGEKESWVKEVIALAKEFHFVTPYTSFIAAPRALLRPRVIQPGDPVLRVKVPADITRVAVLFPFGLQKALRYLPSEDVWETRFLAPTWMKDGTYTCTLVLTDTGGRKTSEEKSFVIDSKPPDVAATLGARTARPGERVAIEVRADADTRRITARLDQGPAAEVVWDPEKKRSLGAVLIPTDTATGTHLVTVTAEDMAHNVSSAQVALDVAGGAR